MTDGVTSHGPIRGQRDKGLVRAVGPWGLAASIVSIVVGAGIFAVPGALASTLGPYAPFAFLVCSLAVGAVALCFAEGGSRMPTSGGIYGYIDAALGPLTGYVGGTLLWFGCVLSCGGVAAALADVVASVTPTAFAQVIRAPVILGVVGCVAVVNVRGVIKGTKLVGILTALKLLPLAVFVLIGAGAVHAVNYSPPPGWHMIAPGRAILLAAFTVMGMETSLCASGEVRQPSRTIPLALLLALGAVTFLYLAIQIIAQGILGASLAHSAVPLADAMSRVHPALRALMLAGAAFSMFGYIGSDILGTPRVLFALGRDGMMPRALGRIHGRNHTPYVAILVYASIAAALALTGTFQELAVLSALTNTVLYSFGCLAAWLLVRRGVALAGQPLGLRWIGSVALFGIASMLALIALASRAEIIGLALLVMVSALVYLLQTRVAFARAGA